MNLVVSGEEAVFSKNEKEKEKGEEVEAGEEAEAEIFAPRPPNAL